jgi:hypothetical protein
LSTPPLANLQADDEVFMQLFETPPSLPFVVLKSKKSTVSIPKKSSGYDLITGLILKALPPIGIKYLTQLFNSALFLGYFPAQWKDAQIISFL